MPRSIYQLASGVVTNWFLTCLEIHTCEEAIVNSTWLGQSHKGRIPQRYRTEENTITVCSFGHCILTATVPSKSGNFGPRCKGGCSKNGNFAPVLVCMVLSPTHPSRLMRQHPTWYTSSAAWALLLYLNLLWMWSLCCAYLKTDDQQSAAPCLVPK